MTLVVKGYREFLRASDRAAKESKRVVRTEFRAAGEIVKVDAAARFRPLSPHAASGFRVAVRQRGVSVEQRQGKTTGLHPEFGTLQMKKGLLPAADAQEPAVVAAFERATGRICDHFERS